MTTSTTTSPTKSSSESPVPNSSLKRDESRLELLSHTAVLNHHQEEEEDHRDEVLSPPTTLTESGVLRVRPRNLTTTTRNTSSTTSMTGANSSTSTTTSFFDEATSCFTAFLPHSFSSSDMTIHHHQHHPSNCTPTANANCSSNNLCSTLDPGTEGEGIGIASTSSTNHLSTTGSRIHTSCGTGTTDNAGSDNSNCHPRLLSLTPPSMITETQSSPLLHHGTAGTACVSSTSTSATTIHHSGSAATVIAATSSSSSFSPTSSTSLPYLVHLGGHSSSSLAAFAPPASSHPCFAKPKSFLPPAIEDWNVHHHNHHQNDPNSSILMEDNRQLKLQLSQKDRKIQELQLQIAELREQLTQVQQSYAPGKISQIPVEYVYHTVEPISTIRIIIIIILFVSHIIYTHIFIDKCFRSCASTVRKFLDWPFLHGPTSSVRQLFVNFAVGIRIFLITLNCATTMTGYRSWEKKAN